MRGRMTNMLGCRYIPGAAAGCDWIMVGCWDVLVGIGIRDVRRVLAQPFVLEPRMGETSMEYDAKK
jgi:hypothetical protein